MSDYPDLVGAVGDVDADDKLFRIGAVKVWAEVQGDSPYNVAVHDVVVNYGLGGTPSASALLGVGLPFGPDAEDYRQIQASMDTIERGTQVKLKIRVLEQTFDDNDYLGAMLPAGTYLLFDGVVGGTNVQTAEDSKDVGLSINLTHRVGLKMSANTTIFGPYPPGSLNMEEVGALYTAIGEAQPDASPDSANIWDEWIAANLLWVMDKNNAYARTDNDFELDIFSEYENKQLQYLQEALSETQGFLPLKVESGITSASRHDISEHITKYIIRGAKAANALNLTTQLGEDMFYSVFGLASKLYVLPYWPYRKISEMLALKAGSFVVANHKDTTLMARGAFLGGVAVCGSPISNFLARLPQNNGDDYSVISYTGSYKWSGISNTEKDYVTIDAVRAPNWLFAAYSPTPDSGETPKREDHTTTRPMHAPANVSTDEKVKAGKPIYDDILDQFARFMTLEGIVKGDKIDVFTPLRFDIVPGKVLRLDQTTIGRKRQVTEAEALYGHVQSVMLRVSAVSRTAGIQAVISHAHNYKDQQKIEEQETGPFAYNTSYYSTLNGLSLVEEDDA